MFSVKNERFFKNASQIQVKTNCVAPPAIHEPLAITNVEVWLSLVERCVRDAEAAGSSPVTSTVLKDRKSA